MVDPTQFSFDLPDLTTALIKHQGIHTGKWMLSFDLAFFAGLFGPSPTDARPGSAAAIQRVNLVRPPDEVGPAAHLIVDAAIVNPRAPLSPKRQGKKP
jgi:hypothetical protein